jgi:hypothetical protein
MHRRQQRDPLREHVDDPVALAMSDDRAEQQPALVRLLGWL